WMVVVLLRRHRRARLADGARLVTIFTPPTVEAASAERLWSHLHEVLLRPRWRRWFAGQPHVAFEYRWSTAGLRIALWVPGGVPPAVVERAVEAAWPAARTATEPATGPLPEAMTVVGGAMRLARPGWFPLRAEHDSDPLRALLAAGEPGMPGEHVAVQVLARPLTRKAQARCRQAAFALRTGRPTSRVLRLLDLVMPGPATPAPPATDPIRTAQVRAVTDKAAWPLWHVEVRYGVATPRESTPVRRALAGRADALASAFALFTGPYNQLAPGRLAHVARHLAERTFSRGGPLSAAELAALAHLPLDPIVPSLARAGARSVAPPPDVPRAVAGAKILGDADQGNARPVALATADARYHLHVMGATGSGKSTLLTNLVLQDVEARRGAIVVDPKGDLVADILARVPDEQRHRVVLLDPDSGGDRPTLNMLDIPKGVPPEVAVDHLVGIFARIFDRHWGPRLEDVLRSACLTLLHREGARLSAIEPLLTQPGRWQHYLGAGEPDPLRGFWGWYEAQGVAAQAQVINPLLYKLRAFLLRPFVRDVVDADRSTLDMPGVLDGKLLLVRIPKGTLGEDTSRLLGSFVVARAWQAALARAALGQQARADASLYVDECQNFLTLPRSFDEMLAEARGYRLSLVLAHQHLGQLPRELRDAIGANARNKVLFTCSPDDARILERHMLPNLTAHDLANLGAYQAAVRLVVSGQDQPAFTVRTRPAIEPGAAA
ncbi:MAG: type IV secretory system conjugative DNA transfer family protein, partial [Mycobacteriales bacterium]